MLSAVSFLVSTRRLARAAGFALALFTLNPAAVFAQEQTHAYEPCTREPSESEVAAAKGAFQAGQASFNEADYPRAIVYWEDAYRRDCTAHALLLNLARAFELHGQKRQAVVALQTYLDRKPDPAQVSAINKRIEVLNEQIQKEDQAAAPAAPAAPPPTTTAPEPMAPPPPEPDSPSRGGRPIAPLIIAGAGGVAFVTGLVIWSGANADLNEIEEICGSDRVCTAQEAPTNFDELAQQGNDARGRKTVGGIVMGIGGLAAAGGLIWYFVSPSGGSAAAASPKLARPRVDPLVAPGFAGLSVTGAF